MAMGVLAAMKPASPPPPGALLERAAAMRARLRELAPQANRDRKVPDENIQAFKDAGFFRLVQPTRFGGYDCEGDISGEIVDELAMGCPSSGWVYGVLALHHLFMAAWPEEVQQEVWGEDPDILISSSLGPRPITRVPGGFRMTGDWSFSSGCDHCEWAMLGGLLEGEESVMLLVPMTDLTIVDDWHTLGLRGTGSKTLRLKDVFVPERRVVPLHYIYSGSRGVLKPGGSFWDIAPVSMFGANNFSAVALGLARRAIDLTTEVLRTKKSRGVHFRDIASYRMKLAEAISTTEMARFQMHESCRQHVARVRNGEFFKTGENEGAARDVAIMVTRLTESVMSLAGIHSRWVYEDDPMQRVVCDMLTASIHRSANWEAIVLPTARFILDDIEEKK